MNTLTIFGTQFVLSVIMFALIARWFVAPWLTQKPLHVALMVMILPHAFRHLGLSFLVPGLVADPIPRSFATAAAYGDFTSGLLAILALVALRGRWRLALPLVWLFSLVGTVDLVNALRQAEAVPHLLTTWYIPTFVVPVLLVTHGMIYARLLKHAPQRSASSIEAPGSC
jgi:hypothetical protein